MNTLVIKLGSLALTSPAGGIDLKKFSKIAQDIKILSKNYHIAIVSSGAINTARNEFTKINAKEISHQQAAAAYGQPVLMKAYHDALSPLRVAQILLTYEDIKSNKRSLNIKNTINHLLKNNMIPIINENDSTSYDEITLGDNDQLSVMIAELLSADKLIILSETDGLYDRDPKELGAKKISQVNFNESLKIKTHTKNPAGRGGMRNKLEAISKATHAGIDVILSGHQFDRPLLRALENEGTYFQGKKTNKKLKKKWLSAKAKAGAYLKINQGAYLALIQGKSLLPVGIKSLEGKFSRGDIVSIKYQRKVIAYGQVEYSSKDLSKIQGKDSQEIATIVLSPPSLEAIHRDNLFVLKEDE